MKLPAITLALIIILSSIQIGYGEPSTSITYLKDKIKENGYSIYKVDYATLKLSPDSPIVRAESTENSKVKVTDSEVITDIVLKLPSKENPNSYDIDASSTILAITNVEVLDNGLNKYNLNPPIESDSIVITPTLVETSHTTAEFIVVIDY